MTFITRALIALAAAFWSIAPVNAQKVLRSQTVSYDNYTALEAVSFARFEAGAAVIIAASGRAGTFIKVTSDESALATADPNKCVFIPSPQDVTGASGGYMRSEWNGVKGQLVNLAWCGVDTTGAIDASSIAQSVLTNFNGFLVPEGSVRLNTAISTNASNVTIKGVGNGKSKILLGSAASGGIILGTGSGNPETANVENLDIDDAVTQTGGASITIDGYVGARVTNVTLRNPYRGIWVKSGVIHYFTDIRINDAVLYGMQFDGGNDQYVSNTVIDAGGTEPSAGIKVFQSDAFWLDRVDVLNGGDCLSITPGDGQFVSWVFITDSAFDNCSGDGIDITSTGTGFVKGVSFTQSWGSTNDGNGVNLGGALRGARFVGFRAYNNALNGFNIASTGVVDVAISHSSIAGNSRGASGTYSGVAVAAGVTQFQISNNRIGAHADFADTQANGVLVNTGASDVYSIVDNDLRNNAAILTDNGSGSNKIVTCNIGVGTTCGAAAGATLGANTFTGSQTVALASGTQPLTLQVADDTANGGPIVATVRNSASPAANDGIGEFAFYGNDSAANDQLYSQIDTKILDATSGSEDGQVRVITTIAGTPTVTGAFANGLVVGSASGGDQGAGTVNATAFFDDGVALPALGAANAFTAAQSITVTGLGGLTIASTDAGASGGPTLTMDRNSASPAVSDLLATLSFTGRDSGAASQTYGSIDIGINDATAGSEDSQFRFITPVAGSLQAVMTIAGGVVVGSPTGGDKGVGTLNATAVYDDNVLLTDYVFDKLRGQPQVYSEAVQARYDALDAAMFDPSAYADYWRREGRLFGMPDLDDVIDVTGVLDVSVGDMVQRLTQTAELQAIHIDDVNKRLTALEGDYQQNKKRVAELLCLIASDAGAECRP